MLEKHSPNPPKQPKIAAATTSAQTIGTLAQFASQKIRYLMNIPNVERKRKNVFFRHVIIENFTFYVYVFTFIFRDCQALTNVLMIRADSGDSCSFFDHSVKICQICVRWCG